MHTKQISHSMSVATHLYVGERLSSRGKCKLELYRPHALHALHLHTYETCNVDDLYQASCAHEQSAHGLQWQWPWLWWPTNTPCLWHLWTLPDVLKQTEADFSPVPTDSLHLQVAQMSKSRDLVIFMLKDRQQTKLIVHVYRVTMREKGPSWPD